MKLRSRRMWPLVFLAVIVSCEDEQPVLGPTEPPDLREAARPVRGRLNYDDRMAAIADELPGFAGFFYESPEQLIVQLKDVGRLTEARNKVGEFFRQEFGDNAAVAAEYNRHVNQMAARPVKYDFRELRTWYLELVKHVFAVPGGVSDIDDIRVTSSDIDEAQNRIVIGVRKEEDIDAVMAEVEKLAVPSDAVVVKHVPGVMRGAASLQGTVRPVVGGIQIRSPYFECTLGYNVDHSSSNYWYFVTNAHCTRKFGEVWGDDIGQPTSGSKIGDEVADPELFDDDDDDDCPSGYDCRNSDAALIKYSTSDWTHGHIAWPADTGTVNFSYTKKITSDGTPVQGYWVHKVGRTTGRTIGQITDVCWSGPVGYDAVSGPDYVVYLICQARADYPQDQGDSGSPVVWSLWNTNIAVGLHWGADTATGISGFSPGPRWRDELGDEVGATLYTDIGHSPPPTVTINGPSIVHPDWSCYWNASVTPGVPPYFYAWSGVLSGTGSSVWGTVSSSGDLRVDVEDDVEHTGYTYKWITVSESAPYHPNCAEK